MEIQLQRELNKLNGNDFQRASDIFEGLASIILEKELKPQEIGLCSSRIFSLENGFITFLERSSGYKDQLISNTKKQVFKIIAQYVKTYKQYVSEYLDLIIQTCIQQFKKEEAAKAKDSSLIPIIRIYKHCDLNYLTKLGMHQALFKTLVQELYHTKLTSTIKARIFQTLGILIKDFPQDLQSNHIFTLAYQTLLEQIQSNKPELILIEGIIKFFTYCLQLNPFGQNEIRQLFLLLKTFCQPNENLSSYKVPIAACKCMKDNINNFNHLLLDHPIEHLNQLINIVSHKNRDLKEEAQELLEIFISNISELLNQNDGQHRFIFSKILDKLIEILDAKQKDMFLTTVAIRAVGQFAKAIKNVKGDQLLRSFFDQLIELGQENIFKEYDKFYEDSKDLKKGAQFKILLYRQKQLNSFLISYGYIIINLDFITEKQLHHIFDLSVLCIKQHYNYFENYRPYLYDGLANLIKAIQQHQLIASKFLSSMLSKGTGEGLKVFDENTYIKTCEEIAKLWCGVFTSKLWTIDNISKFVQVLYDQIIQLILNTNFESTQKEEIEQETEIFTVKLQEFRYIANNPIQLTYFHRYILFLSNVIPNIPYNAISISHLIYLLRVILMKIRKYPRAILLLILTRIFFKQIKEIKDLMNIEIIEQLVIKIKIQIVSNLKIYNQQLQIQALCLLLVIPYQMIIKNNYLLLKQEYIQYLITSLQIKDNNHLSQYAIDLLINLIQQSGNQNQLKELLRILKNVIPLFSNLMQLIDEQEKPIYQQIKYIDQIYPYELLNELNITRQSIINKVRYFLGSIGGLCHLIVDEAYSESLLALDYNSPITVGIPLGQRKLKIRFGQFLGRVLYLSEHGSQDKIKVNACELLQALVIFMIGDQAKNPIKGTENNMKKKIELANIYKLIFPIIISISNTNGHPCKIYMKDNLTKIVHWFSNSKQYEAPDTGQLLDCLFEQAIQYEQLCCQLIGEFIQWTIKQSSQEQLKKNYSNIKTVIKRIMTYINHPDMRYKNIAMECILQFVKYTQNEEFIVNKYYLQLIESMKYGFLIEDKDISQIILNANSITEIISVSFEKFGKILLDESNDRHSKNKNLYQISEFLLKESMIGKDGPWQQTALILWYMIINNTKKYLFTSPREILLSESEMKNDKLYKLFPKYQFKQLTYSLKDTNSLEILCWQCRIWQFLLDKQIFQIDEITNFQDFLITINNIQDFLTFFTYNKNTQNETSQFIDGLMSLTQDNFNPSQQISGNYTSIVMILSETLIEQLIQLFERVFKCIRHFRIDIEQHFNITLSLILKPSHLLKDIQLDLYIAQFEQLTFEIQQLLSNNITYRQFRNVLDKIFDNNFESFEKILLNREMIKDITELRYFLNGIKWIIKQAQSHEENSFNKFYNDMLEQISKIIINFEIDKQISNEPDRIPFLLEFLLQNLESKTFVMQNLFKSSEFKQKYEDQLINFIAINFEQVGQIFFQYACKEISNFQLGIILLNKVYQINPNSLKKFYTFQFKVDRSNSSLLLLEIQHNNILLNYIKDVNNEYLKELLKESLNPTKPIEIHIDGIVLFGLYVKNIDDTIPPSYLNDLGNRYFPIKITDLKKDSIDETNFNIIIKKLLEMLKLCGNIKYIESIFTIIRQEFNLDQFIKEFMQLNPESINQLRWLMFQIKDIELDKSQIQNVRISLANKILIPMLNNSKLLLEFYVENIPYLLTQLPIIWDSNWKQIIFQIQWRTVIYQLLAIAYSRLPVEIIKGELYQQLKYQNDSELTKKLVIECTNGLKPIDTLGILRDNHKEIMAQINYQKLIEDYYCSVYISYIYVLMKTQTKESVITPRLFKRDIPFWENFIRKEWDFEFKVETSFEERPLYAEVQKAQQELFTDKIIKNYLSTATLAVEEIQIQQIEIEEPLDTQNITSEQIIELDDINQHKLMIPMLQLVDFLSTKFEMPVNTMPTWMTIMLQIFQEQQLYLSLKVFLIKLIINKIEIFNKYASAWIGVLLDYCTKENKPNGGKGFHYFLRDVIITLIKFSQNQLIREEYLSTHPQSKEKICSVVNNLVTMTPDKNKKLFESNIQIVSMFIQLYREQMYISENQIIKMINMKQTEQEKELDDTQDNSELWQANGLAILHLALMNKVPILSDYAEFIRSRELFYKYRFILDKRQTIKFPTESLLKLASQYSTKRNILQGVANVYGAALYCCNELHQPNNYETEIVQLVDKILTDNRPGYAKERFTIFMKSLINVYPQASFNGTLFQELISQIGKAKDREKTMLLEIFIEFLQIENNDQMFYVNQIIVAIQGNIDKIIEEQEDAVHFALLSLLKQLSTSKWINICGDQLIHCFTYIISKLDGRYQANKNAALVSLYQQVLQLLDEQLINFENKELSGQITSYLLQLFTSQHTEIRQSCFKYLQESLDKRMYLEKQQTITQIELVLQLMLQIYQPTKEQLWLRGAVPLILNQSKKTSEYSSNFFQGDLEAEAHFYDQEFNKYFKKVNLSQYGGLSQQSYASQILSQAMGISSEQGLKTRQIRATQQQQLSQDSYSLIDSEGFKIPTKTRVNSSLSQFFQTNEISFQQVQLTQNNQVRYLPEGQLSQRENAKKYYKLKTQQNQTQEGFEKFVKNKVRSYREGDLPDIGIKYQDIVDPLIGLCFEDEELSGRLFTSLFQELYERNASADKLYEELLQLLKRSQQKSFIFISTILRTLYQVLSNSEKLMKENDIVSKVGIESLAYYQSMILTEQCILRLENDDKQSKFWLDLMDLHQSQANNAELEGILTNLVSQKPEYKTIKEIMDMKHQQQYGKAYNDLKSVLEQISSLQYEKDSLDGRMVNYLKQEYEDTCQKLGYWEQLDTNLNDQISDSLPQVKRLFHKYLMIDRQTGQINIQGAKELDQQIEKLKLSDHFLLEKTLILIAEGDIDQSRFYIHKAQNYFIQKWTSLLSQNQLLSKKLRHCHLEQLQIMHEMEEIQQIYNGNEIDFTLRDKIFERWATRSPSSQKDSLYTWHRIFQNRRIMGNINDVIVGKWLAQLAKGMVKMGLVDQSSQLLGVCMKQYNYREGSVYSTLAKFKFKQESLTYEQQDFQSILLKFEEDFDRFESHVKLRNFFLAQIQQNNLQDLKTLLLPLRSLQHYLKINHDLVFLFTQEQKKSNKNFQSFFERYGNAIKDVFQEYTNFSQFNTPYNNNLNQQIHKINQQYQNYNQYLIDANPKHVSKFYKKAALFCEKVLRCIEPDSGGSTDLRIYLANNEIGIDQIADHFVRYTIQAFKLGQQLEMLLIKVIKMVQKFPLTIGPIFDEGVRTNNLQTKVFLPFLPQLIFLINDENRIKYFVQIFRDFLKKYPQQFVYQFNVAYQQIEDCKTQPAQQLFKQLHTTLPRNFTMIQALNQLSHPEQRFQAYLLQMRDCQEDEEYQKYLLNLLELDVFTKDFTIQGSYNIQYMNKRKNLFYQFKDGKKDFMYVLQEIMQECREIQHRGQQNINDMSPWFLNYTEESLESGKMHDIQIPIKLNSYFDVNTIPKIASFDQTILVLQSLRKPKRLTIYGSDEKQYLFLVKGGEDLRLDQRIEQLFDVMNSITKQTQLFTYGVFPMTKMFGMLEWVSNTTSVKDVIDKEHFEVEGKDLFQNRVIKIRDDQVSYLNKKFRITDKVPQPEQLCALQFADSDYIIKEFEYQKSLIKDDLLRNGLAKLCSSIEAFVFIRDNFLINYAAICASGYILGIGDRHLENILINYTTGALITIDFGCAFGQGIGLQIPELMPFRLTQLFEGLSKPVGLSGLYRNQFVQCLDAIRRKRHILIDFCEIFISDPLLETVRKTKAVSEEYIQQVQNELRIEEEIYQRDSLSSSTGIKNQFTFQSRKKIDIVRKKLIGVHCSFILLEELEESRHCSQPYRANLDTVVIGKDRLRYQYQHLQTLSVIQQVDCLIDLATDPNVLGRAWKGWAPFF